MAVSVIEQQPLYNQLPVGSEIIFTVSNDDAVANQTKVKFCVDVAIWFTPANTSSSVQVKGTFKTTPNDAGVGMFNLSNIVENYVKADNMAAPYSSYKGTLTTWIPPVSHPIHLIDQYSGNNNSMRYMALKFYVEYANAVTGVVEADTTTARVSEDYLIFNGYLKYTDDLNRFNQDFGFAMNSYIPVAAVFPATSNKSYLTNAPTTQYANSGDYGTLAFFVPSLSAARDTNNIVITYYNDSGTISSPDIVTQALGTGSPPWNSHVYNQMLFFGCFPGNLENWSSNYATAVTAGLTYYTISAQDDTLPIAQQSLRTMTIRLNCPDLKNYESIRLTWLNQWGAWDYYTFTKKSIKSVSTQGTTYTQLGGTWNDRVYKIDSYKGGKKSFRINATEKIRVNTDFVSEDFNVMFEELINSPEVYLLQGFQTDTVFSALSKYVTPVRITTSNFTRKTSANDNLIQYTFEIEKSKTLRTQSV